MTRTSHFKPARMAAGIAALLVASGCATPAPDSASVAQTASEPASAVEPMAVAAPASETNMVTAQIAAVVASDGRTESFVARDGFRNPTETLSFWGLRSGMTVAEIGPGGGYWSEILSPYAVATGGVHIAGQGDPANTDERGVARLAAYQARFPATKLGVFDPGSDKPLAEPGTVDLIISARNFHGFYLRDIKDYALSSFMAALKPGGLVGIEQHRGDPTKPNDPSSGYIRQDVVIADMEAAGFEFVAASEINANAADTKDHPFGVWTLPPVGRTSAFGEPENPDFDRTPFDAIGESDRMTLLFRKPA